MRKKKITRRTFVKSAAVTGLTGTSLRVQAARTERSDKKPNIILIMADDLGYECLGAYGGTSYRTRVLDQLAKNGLRADHCYSQPLCTPSRVQLMTGMYNVRNYVKFGLLPRDQTTFAQLLKKSGYATCVVGKWQLGREPDSPAHAGFDESCLWQHTRGRTRADGTDSRYSNPSLDINGEERESHDGEYGPDVVTDFACDFIERKRHQPFLVYYPMILTHCPFCPTPDSEEWNPSSRGSETYKGEPEYFGDMVEYVDKTVGRILNKLEELRLREDTLVLFTGDNGTDRPVVSQVNGRSVAGGKGATTNAGTRVPLIASWPRFTSEGRVCSDLIDFSDFFPTLCEAAAVTIPSGLAMDGTSFLPQIRGKRGDPREWIYCWFSRDGETNLAKEFVRNKRYKLYRSGEFYDILKDELEENNLQDSALDQEVTEIKRSLQHALDQYKDARPPELRNR